MPVRRSTPAFRAPRVRNAPAARECRPLIAMERLEGRALMSSTWADALAGVMDPAAVAVQQDGSVIVAGSRYVAGSGTKAVVAKLTPQGQLDTTFGAGGVATAQWYGSTDFATGVAVTADGKIVISGFAGLAGPVPGGDMSDMGVARFNADGTLDTSFGGGDGVAVVNVSYGLAGGADAAYGVALDAQGRVVLVGSINYKASTEDVWWAGGFAAARLLPDGSPDASFGTGGMVITLFAQPESTPQCSATAVQVLDDGDLLASGYRGGPTSGTVTTVRYNADGSPDTAHGDTGIRYTTDAYAAPAITWPTGATTQEPAPAPPPEAEPPAVAATVPAKVSKTAMVRRGAYFKFTVHYASETGNQIDLSSLGTGDVAVSGPGGFSADAELVRAKAQKRGTVVRATYRAAAPGGRFDAADNGEYALVLTSSAVNSTEGDSAGTTGAECVLGGFLVSCRANPASVATTPKRLAEQVFSDSLPVA